MAAKAGELMLELGDPQRLRGGSISLNRTLRLDRWSVCRVQAAAICGSRVK
jgi:hypothetical protein